MRCAVQRIVWQSVKKLMKLMHGTSCPSPTNIQVSVQRRSKTSILSGAIQLIRPQARTQAHDSISFWRLECLNSTLDSTPTC
jgi:hypothetical protein